ncbi:trypsin-like peptidase domain-containing protein [Candidatus Saccharibacteria bacterium]|nr:trypsin-like peptidase domain-containing protein [Candidatus Saccharibacteria bacterium]
MEEQKPLETSSAVVPADPILTPEDAESNPSTPEKRPEKQKRPGRGLAITALILSIFSILSSVFAAVVSVISIAYSSENFTRTPAAFSLDSNSANFVEGSIAEVAADVAPSVVSIITETKTTSIDFFFRETESTGAAAGTGIIVSSDGYVLTNKHVIESATKIYIVSDSGTVYRDVELLATDPLNDVAYLKIPNVTDLPAATIGDSKTISIGQQVIAIGNALGQYQNTVTSGIISGTGRSLTATDSNYQNAESLTDMIQTDAAINSGNSGGPLVNAAGEVIGINTAVSDGNGIGFAIPISAVKGMLKSILETGKAKRAYAGIQYQSIDATTAIENNLSVTAGAYVSDVIKGSPAESAGLKKTDIIIAVDGVEIGANRSLGTLLGEHTVGDSVSLVVLRNNQNVSLTLTLTEYPE